MSTLQLTVFFSSLAITALLMIFARVALRNRLLRHTAPSAELILDDEKLRPAEIAYLSSHGDVSHTLLVLGVDLVQRAIKSKLSGETPKLEWYETNMWELARESVTDWAQSKADKHLPSELHKNPMEYVRRVSRLYNFLAHTVRSFVAQILADPRHIRKYLRFSAVASLVADFSTSGYKAAFEEQFRLKLTQRGLLVPKSARVKFANYYFFVAASGAIAIAALTMFCVKPWPLALLMTVAGFLSAGVLRAALLVVHLIPLYSEIADVIAHLDRKSWRLQMLRLTVRAISVLSVGIIALGFVVLNGVFDAIVMLLFQSHDYVLILTFASLVLSYMVPFQLIFEGWTTAIDELATEGAQRRLKDVRKRLGSRRPFDAFKEVLQTTEYEPTLSELLAIYGIETLLLLA